MQQYRRVKQPWGTFGPRVGFAWSPDLGAHQRRAWQVFASWRFRLLLQPHRRRGHSAEPEHAAVLNYQQRYYGLGKLRDPAFADPYSDVAGRATQANPFPFGSTSPAAHPQAIGLRRPMSLNVFDKHYSSPQAMNFNLTMQREFASNTVLSVGYVGALGRRLVRAIEGNPITLAGQAACVADPTCNPALSEAGFTFQHANYPDHSEFPGDIYGSVGTREHDRKFQLSRTPGRR